MSDKSRWVESLGGLLLAFLAACSFGFGWHGLDDLERKAYDMRARLRQDIDPSSEVILVSIDEPSLARLGPWPWPRSRLAEMVDLLAKAEAKVIALDLMFQAPEREAELAELSRMRELFEQGVAAKRIVQKGVDFRAELSSAAVRLDTDSRLVESLRACKNAVLPMMFSDAGRVGGKPEDLPPELASFSLDAVGAPRVQPAEPPREAWRAQVPILPLVGVSAAVGHANTFLEADGVLRREAAAVRYGTRYFPSFAVAVAARYLGLSAREVRLHPGEALELGDRRVPLDASNSFWITFNGSEGTFRNYSFHDVLEGKVEPDVFRGKAVLVGLTAPGAAPVRATPVTKALPSVEITANAVENMLDRRFVARPPWAQRVEAAALLICAVFLVFVLPRMGGPGAAALTLLLLLWVSLGGAWLLTQRGEWVRVVHPLALLAAGAAASFVLRAAGRRSASASAAPETSIDKARAEGRAFQAKGRLEAAFERFRKCPLDGDLAELCYLLGADFEKAGKPDKAAEVFRHVAQVYPGYKDIPARLAARAGGASGREGAPGGGARTMIGRYEIERELGRGAMGVVYLGRDPKIGRTVAVKTMSIGAGMTPAEAKEARGRFFREAESAGTLNHPGIVKVYDAGECGEGCYIAMEYLDGRDLTAFTRKASLLPPQTALEYAALVAEALGYAHSKRIAHLDVKPANLMLLADGTIRVADFGIAQALRSPTAGAGGVLGTPAYMSPEQVAGAKVDGRSDLFSLGVVLFELLTGEKPFTAPDLGGLLYQIVNAPAADALALRPELPPAAAAALARALQKSPDARFQTGEEMAAALRSPAVPEPGPPTVEEIASSLVLPGAGNGFAPADEEALVAAELDEAAAQIASETVRVDPGQGGKA